jgi:hypothetical protein
LYQTTFRRKSFKKHDRLFTQALARLCENSDSVILKNEKAVRITFTENKNAP